MAEGKIKVRTEIFDGFENALQAVKRLYTGANTGKLMIRVHEGWPGEPGRAGDADRM